MIRALFCLLLALAAPAFAQPADTILTGGRILRFDAPPAEAIAIRGQEIAALETGYRLGRILVAREVLKQAPAGFSAATKCFCTEHEQRVADFVSRVFGAEAMLWNDITQGLAYAPAYTIMGGTSNVMRNILGERVLGLPK